MGKTLLSLWGMRESPDIGSQDTASDAVEDASGTDREDSSTIPLKHENILSKSASSASEIATSNGQPDNDGITRRIVSLKYRIAPTPQKYLLAKSLVKGQSSFCAPPSIAEETKELASQPKEDELVSARTRRTLIVTLKCANERLQGIQAKRHSFFAKRATVPVAKSESSMVLKPLIRPKPILPCFPQFHAIPLRSEPMWRLPRRVRSGMRKPDQIFNTADSLRVPSLTHTVQRRPKLLKTSHAGFREIIQTSQRQTEKLHPFVRASVEVPSTETRFDQNLAEVQLWVDKYAPVAAKTCLHSKEATNIRSWVKQRSRELKSTSWKATRDSRLQTKVESELDDFIVPDETEGSVPAVLIICGRPGQGKTASVYAIAKELDSFVVESNNSNKRTGKSLSDLVDGIGQSKAVHSNSSQKSGRDCIVLIEEVDKLFEAESQSYLAALDKLIYSCRRPVILTCESTESLPYNLLDKRIAQICRFETTNARNVSDIAWHIAVSEGHILDRTVVDQVALYFLGDLRKTVNYLQFWCQKTLGGRKSGIDWMITPEERPSVDRVVSVNTPVELPPAKETLQNAPSSLMQAASIADTLSLLDRPVSVQYAQETDSLNGIPFTVDLEDERQEAPVWTPDLEAVNYLKKVSKRSPDIMHLSIPVYDEWNAEVTLELAPYYRHFARCDRWRHNKLSGARRENSRLSRRSWASIGIDSREFVPDWQAVLKEFCDNPDFDVNEDAMLVPVDCVSSQSVSMAGSSGSFETE